MGKDILISPTRQLGWAANASIVGTAPDGSLILDVADLSPLARMGLVKLGLNGTVEAREIPRHDDHEVFVDRDGIAHILVADADQRTGNYVQMSVKAHGLPEVRAMSYDRRFKQFASVPEYLKWQAGSVDPPYGLSFFSEGRGRLLVAKATFAPGDTCFHLYRIDTKTLAVLDSGSADLRQDVYRTWNVGTHRWSDSTPLDRLWWHPAVARTTIVPAGESGYWVFTPTSNPGYQRTFTPVSDTPAPTVVAYRFSRDLKALHPTRAVRAEAKPFASAKQDGVVSVSGLGYGIPRYEQGVQVVPTKVKLDFVAFDRDGELYLQTYEDSLTSRPMH